jgi:hypothetical protein
MCVQHSGGASILSESEASLLHPPHFSLVTYSRSLSGLFVITQRASSFTRRKIWVFLDGESETGKKIGTQKLLLMTA